MKITTIKHLLSKLFACKIWLGIIFSLITKGCCLYSLYSRHTVFCFLFAFVSLIIDTLILFEFFAHCVEYHSDKSTVMILPVVNSIITWFLTTIWTLLTSFCFDVLFDDSLLAFIQYIIDTSKDYSLMLSLQAFPLFMGIISYIVYSIYMILLKKDETIIIFKNSLDIKRVLSLFQKQSYRDLKYWSSINKICREYDASFDAKIIIRAFKFLLNSNYVDTKSVEGYDLIKRNTNLSELEVLNLYKVLSDTIFSSIISIPGKRILIEKYANIVLEIYKKDSAPLIFHNTNDMRAFENEVYKIFSSQLIKLCENKDIYICDSKEYDVEEWIPTDSDCDCYSECSEYVTCCIYEATAKEVKRISRSKFISPDTTEYSIDSEVQCIGNILTFIDADTQYAVSVQIIGYYKDLLKIKKLSLVITSFSDIEKLKNSPHIYK